MIAGTAAVSRAAAIGRPTHLIASNPPRKFAGQSCNIEHEPTIYSTGVDGKTTHARQPTNVLWYEGKAEWFGRNAAGGVAITNVKIVAGDGTSLIDDWGLTTIPGVPRDVGNGVEFFVLQPE